MLVKHERKLLSLVNLPWNIRLESLHLPMIGIGIGKDNDI